jgi:hypothetical protein
MGRTACLALAVVAVLSLAGCGSGHRRSNPRYSASRVSSAFTKRGLALHKASGTCGEGYVCLENSDESVRVYVFVGHRSGQVVMAVDSTERQSSRANVTAVSDRQHESQVTAALQALR